MRRDFFLQLRELVVIPTLTHLGLDSPAARNLVLGTAAQESGGSYLAQLGGPALGFWQIEPATHGDLLINFVAHRPELDSKLEALMTAAADGLALEMAWNLRYGCAVCRLLYYRIPAPLPEAADLAGLGAYWKQFYNTPLGAGTADEWVTSFRNLIGEPPDA
jgi:hypothetical protein